MGATLAVRHGQVRGLEACPDGLQGTAVDVGQVLPRSFSVVFSDGGPKRAFTRTTSQAAPKRPSTPRTMTIGPAIAPTRRPLRPALGTPTAAPIPAQKRRMVNSVCPWRMNPLTMTLVFERWGDVTMPLSRGETQSGGSRPTRRENGPDRAARRATPDRRDAIGQKRDLSSVVPVATPTPHSSELRRRIA